MGKRAKLSRLSLAHILRKAESNPPRKAQPYECYIYYTCEALVKQWPDPDKLTPAKRKRIIRLFRYAAFASFGPSEN